MAKITAYNVKTKTKNVEMVNPKIDKNGNRYSAHGLSKGGDKLLLSCQKMMLKRI